MNFHWQSRRIIIAALLIVIGVISLHSIAQAQSREPRRKVGTVLGKPVYRDQLDKKQPGGLENSLRQTFLADVFKQYREEHAEEITPTDAEIKLAAKRFDQLHRERIKEVEPELRARLAELEKQAAEPEFDALPKEEQSKLEVETLTLKGRLTAPGERFAKFMLNNWKLQRLIYDRYGGGRLLWQQAGVEAFDATRTLLETLEKEKKFEVTDPEMRDLLYRYWTTQNHGAFLVDDEERIRKSFLEPDWMTAESKDRQEN